MDEDPQVDKETFKPFKKGRRGKMSMYTEEQRNAYARRVHEKEITASDLARELGVTRQGVSLWLKHYREKVLGLKPRPRKPVKKKRFPTRDEMHALQWEMRTLRPSRLGIDGGDKDIWTEESVGAYVAREMGEKFYTSKQVWRWMEDYLIDEEPDPWTIKDRKKREKSGKFGPPEREAPIAFDQPENDDDDPAMRKRKRGRPRKGEESTDVRKLDADEVERMEKEIAEVRADMIARYRESVGYGPPAPGQRVGKNRKATKSRHTKSRKKKRRKK